MRARAISEIRARMQTGELASDNTFSELMICEQLGMSRAPVREALIALSCGGWVEALPRAGWRVRALTLNEARDLLAVRAALAPAAAALAARRAPHDQEATDALQHYIDVEERRAAPDTSVNQLIIDSYRCIRRIARLSGNLEFDRCLEDVLARLVRYYLLRPVSEAMQRHPISLVPVIQSVLDGDADAARDRMAAYASADQHRLTEAIIDSELIQSVRLASSPR